MCNICLLDAENLYFMRVPKFVVMNIRTMPSVLIAFENAVRTLTFLYAYSAICVWE